MTTGKAMLTIRKAIVTTGKAMVTIMAMGRVA